MMGAASVNVSTNWVAPTLKFSTTRATEIQIGVENRIASSQTPHVREKCAHRQERPGRERTQHAAVAGRHGRHGEQHQRHRQDRQRPQQTDQRESQRGP